LTLLNGLTLLKRDNVYALLPLAQVLVFLIPHFSFATQL